MHSAREGQVSRSPERVASEMKFWHLAILTEYSYQFSFTNFFLEERVH